MTGQVSYSSASGNSGQIAVAVPSATEALVTSPSPLRVAGGTIALDGSNPTPITTGLSFITGANVSLAGTAAPGVGTSVLTYNFATVGGTLNAYAWKVTSSVDDTLVASTGTETISWIAVGN